MVQTGIMGAMAMALQRRDYGTTGSTLAGDEIAAGVVANAPKKNYDPLMAMMAMLLFDER